MKVAYRRVSFGAAAAAMFGVAACSGGSKPMDDGLKQDLAASSSALEMAPSAAKPQVVVSAIEGGPQSAPAPAAHRVIPKPTPKPAPRVASNQNRAVEAPAPAPQITQPAPSAPAPQAEPAPLPTREPPPLPPAPNSSQGRQKGVYKTEGQIFQQMPWIRP
jgi:hypothetical protein